MNLSPRYFGQRVLGAFAAANLQAWALVLSLALVLSVLRVLQIFWHWPSGFTPPAGDVWTVLVQGARFDLKVSAVAALLLLPLWLLLPARFIAWLASLVALVYVLASLINLHYFGFYKTPVDPVVFGLFEDDTSAIVKTIWSDFPVLRSVGILLVLSSVAVWLRRQIFAASSRRLKSWRLPLWGRALGIVLSLLLLVLTIKGTLRAMALGRQNVSVTASQFLNDMVPNGMMAFKFAWDGRRESQNLSDPLLGLKRLGYGSPLDAAQALGLDAKDEAALRRQLLAPVARGGNAAINVAGTAGKKNLLFFLMESWSAEPFLYHDAKNFDVLGRLAPTMNQACHFSNFDSVQPGTHPSLESILFSTPITPLTLGPQGKKPIPWSIPLLMQQAGYNTLFVTSARSGWRDLDRVLKTQGFDEVVDASVLKANYPEASLGIWGVWDSYVFKYLSKRLQQSQDKPLFVFVLTSTNHPPYDLPDDYERVPRDRLLWGGERNSSDLWPNLDSWHYATDLLGAFVQQVRNGPLGANTLIAASGDHNVRSFGIYATPQRRPLARQVPFVIWGQDVPCGPQRELPASHRDMFPTLLPLLAVNQAYVKTGRNLLLDPARQSNSALNAPLSLSYYGPVRSAQGSWMIGDPASFMCTSKSQPDCRFDEKLDAQARAQLGLLDWNVRAALH
jgi:phosphoglycerol transferase MdoB-like AlkP superfamily enzyme